MDTDSNSTSVRLPQQRTDVFISYSHKDKKWLDELQIMLKSMDIPPIWADTQIRGGSKWREEISNALASARVAVLLVSPYFLASDFITKDELPVLMEAAERGELMILWVAISHSGYKDTVIEQYQAANDPARPLSTLPRAKRGEQILKICEQIKQAANPGGASGISAKPVPRRLEPARSETKSKPIQYVRADELIDFEEERRTFEEMLDESSAKRLMFVQAPSGRGKTSLLHMVRFRCEEQGLPCCWIDFRGQPYDNPHFSLALAMCDQLGLSPLHLAQALQPLSVYRPEGNLINSHAVAQILTGVSLLHEGLRQRYMKERLRDAFLADLNHFVENNGRAVCLFDSFEDVRTEEVDWLLNTLLRPVAGERLTGVRIVIAGQKWSTLDESEWKGCAHLISALPAMKVEHMKIYAERVKIPITDEEATSYWKAAGGGIPLYMAMVVHNLRALHEAGS